MANRPKTYYPKAFITSGLYTQGKEWMLKKDSKEYIGPYHKYIDGMVMTGAVYNKKNSDYLVPYVEQQTNNTFLYDTIRTSEDVKKYVSPKSHLPSLVLEDYKREWFDRFFARRKNEGGMIIEIDSKQYDTLMQKGKGINGALYQGLKLRWRIAGTKETLVENGVKIYGISETNRRTLFTNEQIMPGITLFLGDLEEYSIYSKLTDNLIREVLGV